MNAVADRVLHARLFQFRLNQVWKDNLTTSPWFARILETSGTVQSILVRDLNIHGKCYGAAVELPHGRKGMAVSCRECIVSIQENSVHVRSAMLPGVDPGHAETQLILVRLNTRWLVDKSEPPWRILVETSPGHFFEEPAPSFEMTGHCFGKRLEVTEETGIVPKMHLGCHGHLYRDAQGHARIWGRV
jgi:hypothetical protein